MLVKALLLTALSLSALTIQIAATPIPQEGAAQNCDNNRQGKSKTADHTCECEHATHCDPNSDQDREEHKEMGEKCKTYCRPEACGCANECG